MGNRKTINKVVEKSRIVCQINWAWVDTLARF
jgi:hypothetical protein